MLSDWLFRARSLLRRAKVEEELDSEMRFHVARQVEAYIKAGLAPDEARRRARLEFGGDRPDQGRVPGCPGRSPRRRGVA